ncbi:MAG: SPFH domain-containing protein [Promethearchaeota archaeon]
MYKKIEGKKFKDYDPKIVAWVREDKGDLSTPLMYSFPQPDDNIKNKKYFAVKDYEKVLFYNKGELISMLGGGVYELDKTARIKGTEIVWIDTSFKDIPWGIPRTEGIPTQDGCIIGVYGDLKLKINDVKTFYNDVVAGIKTWTLQDLRKWIIGLLHTSLRDIFKNYNAKNIILVDREHVINLLISKVTEEFLRYGLELETFNVIGINPPEDVASLFKEEKERTEYLINQKKEIQKRIEELKKKLKEQQDLLLNDKISKEEYENKKIQIETFMNETEKELGELEGKLINK